MATKDAAARMLRRYMVWRGASVSELFGIGSKSLSRML